MPLYETVIIARQDISSQQVETLTEAASAFISDGGGKVAKVEQWGLRNLAYKIKKNRKGHYVLLNIDAPADAVKEMERNLRLNEDVLRHMTIKVDELEEGDSVMLQSRSSRPDRRRDRDDDNDDDDRNTSDKDDETADDSTEKEDA
ncbi:30S ribosomal protein S6 [uncultured Sneathiella sp.]|uniref:30S ribosomal protein S6 n=1 Tax=uncultured Sneathiella sp. TaxID=879315 RepID=UPI0030ED6AA4|tara:strand:+ start:2036 stop:2473 length:438 start_codon:yes stop_codon:yes gene_type:complete